DHPDLTARVGDRLADVARLGERELLTVLLDERGEPAQEADAIARGDRAPGRERGLRARDRGVGLVDSGRVELGDRLLGRGVNDLHGTRAPPRRAPRTAPRPHRPR